MDGVDFSVPADEVVDFDCVSVDDRPSADGWSFIDYNVRMKAVREVDGVHYVGTYTITKDCMGNELNRTETEWLRPL